MSIVYDLLAKIVFFGAIRSSQVRLLGYINANDHVLIVGGGTGWILEEIDKMAKPLTITYVELHAGMMAKSKKRRLTDRLQVHFMASDIRAAALGQYDVIITNYVLDVFAEKDLEPVMNTLHEALKKDGRWIITDFVQVKHAAGKALVKLMYVFFRWTMSIEGNRLLDFEHRMAIRKFMPLECHHFFHKMIRTCIYTRSDG